MILLASAAVSALVSGCGDDGETAAATILEVVNQQVILDGERVAEGDEIPEGGVLATDAGGAARFRIEEDDRPCTIFPASQVAVRPPGELLLRLVSQSGGFDCGGGRSTGMVEAGGARMRLGDSEMAVEVERGNVEVRAPSGNAQVTSANGTVNLGPGQQTSFLIGRPPSPPTRYDTTRTDLPENKIDRVVTTTTPTTRVPATTTTTRRSTTTTTRRR